MRALSYVEIETQPWLDGSPPGDPVVWRFAKPAAYLPRSIDAVASIVDIAFTPAVISLGENLGQRAKLVVSLRDHPHRFASDSYDAGTFWGKWRARFGTRLRGLPLRWITGTLGQALEDMETWHFVIDSTDGPTPDGVYTIIAQDVLKLASGDRALLPRPNDGLLTGSLTNVATSATLGPSGIGNAQYAASGYVNIAGKEVCAFTRSGDALTLTRATTIPGFNFETEVVAHAAGARVQQCYPFISEDAADILYALFTSGAGIPADQIDLPTWQDETAQFLGTIYTTLICEPTGVDLLASEILQQAALSTWGDAKAQLLRLRALRNVAPDAIAITEREFLGASLRTQEQPNARISEVLTYYGLRNPLKPITQADNYRSALLGIDLASQSVYGGLVNKTIFSRWIPFGGGVVANRLNNLLLGRFSDPPRRITFDLYRYGLRTPEPGGAYQVGWRANQDIAGAPVLSAFQITRLGIAEDKYAVEAEELLVTEIDEDFLSQRTIIIDSNINNINLRTLHDSIYPEITGADLGSPAVSVLCIVQTGITVGSTSTGTPALEVGSWPFLPPITLRALGTIEGCAGAAGRGANAPASPGVTPTDTGQPGSAGGTALHTAVTLTLEGTGNIWGGGGGGGGGGATARLFVGVQSYGGGGGGGGAGSQPGPGGLGGSGVGGGPGGSGAPGSAAAGGAAGASGLTAPAGYGGDGGGPGLPGSAGTAGFTASPTFQGSAAGSGGAAGPAIDGSSHVTDGSTADIRGPMIN